MDKRQVSVGFVTGLGYANRYLSPFEEFERLKTHPALRVFLEGGEHIAYGARSITAEGLQSLPRLQINAANYIDHKGCDIKDPTQKIVWVMPQAGEGPNYSDT